MSDGSPHITTLSIVETTPAEFDAGADIALGIRVVCASACDLRGRMVKIIAPGATIKEMGVELTEFDGEATETDEVVVKAPNTPGQYTWTVLFPVCEDEGVQHEQSSADFTFTVKAHQVFMSVWDIPSPVLKGERFTVTIGAKCSAGCSLANLPFVIQDNNNEQVATGVLWKEELAQTRNLYWAEQALVAPSEEGLYEWSAKVITADLKIPHEVTPKQFPFFAARPPEHVATVQVLDKNQKTPLGNAAIFLDRRRASTDKHGIAKIEVTKGTHEMQIAKDHYEPFKMAVEVDGDVTVTVELIFDPDIATIGNERAT
jgi:hypothetical protein